MKYVMTIIAALATICPGAAWAADTKFVLTGDYTADWLISEDAPLVQKSDQGIAYSDIAGNFPGSTQNMAYFDFYAASQGGGMMISDNDTADILAILEGAQLYAGSYTAPQWKLGTFSLTGQKGAGSYSLTISQVTSAVPEPTTWALALVGMGMIGGRLRSRRTLVSVRYA